MGQAEAQKTDVADISGSQGISSESTGAASEKTGAGGPPGGGRGGPPGGGTGGPPPGGGGQGAKGPDSAAIATLQSVVEQQQEASETEADTSLVLRASLEAAGLDTSSPTVDYKV